MARSVQDNWGRGNALREQLFKWLLANRPDLGVQRRSARSKKWVVKNVPCHIQVDTHRARTGTWFIEAVQNDRTGNPGWAMENENPVIILASPKPEGGWHLLQISSKVIQEMLPRWKHALEERKAPNRGWNSIGYLVSDGDYLQMKKGENPVDVTEMTDNWWKPQATSVVEEPEEDVFTSLFGGE